MPAQPGGVVGGGGSGGSGSGSGGTRTIAASTYPGNGGPGACGGLLTHPLCFAELSTNYTAPTSQLDFAALGHLPCGTNVTVTYKGKSLALSKQDVGAGGGGMNGYPRAMDLTFASARALGFPVPGFDLVTVNVGGGSTSGITPSSNPTPTSPWTVGDASNPDQDYWTTISQFCADGQLYCFSDGEFLIVADGVELMSQQPRAILKRTDPTILWPSESTWDNTTFAYASTHVKRGKIQRRAALAKVTSPTEVTIRQICEIDKYRAGDVVYLQDWGAADGPWLIGDCTRSIFQPYSDLTLVQGMQPISAASGIASSSGGNSSGLVSIGGYVNPFAHAHGLIPERIDQGVDFNAQAGSPILALGDYTVFAVTPGGSGWTSPMNTQAFVGYTLQAGAYAGKHVYVAEDIIPKVSNGQTGKAGDIIATFKSSPTGLETGWATGSGYGAIGQGGGINTAAGASFDRLLIKLGCPKAPNFGSGPVTGSIPPGFP